jgi:hypothetical protein
MPRSHRSAVRPQLEVLEDRSLPSAAHTVPAHAAAAHPARLELSEFVPPLYTGGGGAPTLRPHR